MTWPKLLIAGALVVLGSLPSSACQTQDPTPAPQEAPHDASPDHRVGGYQPWGVGGGAPSGTGIAHVSAGAFVSPAAAVSLGSADVTGTLAVANGGTGVATMGASACVPHSAGGTTALTCSAIVNADVSATAAIAASKLAPPGSTTHRIFNSGGAFAANGNDTTDGSGNATLASSLSVGASPAATGDIRGGATFAINHAVGGVDRPILQGDSGPNIILGDDVNCGANIREASASIRDRIAGTYIWYVTASNVAAAVPIVGYSAGSSPYGVHGEVSVAIPTGGAAYTFAASEYANTVLKLTGTCVGGLSGPMHLPSVASDGAGYWKVIRGAWTNGCGNQPTMAVDVSGLSSVTIGLGKTAIIGVDTGGAYRITGDI